MPFQALHHSNGEVRYDRSEATVILTAGRNLIDALEHRHGRRRRQKTQVVHHRKWIDIAWRFWMCKQSLYFRCKDELTVEDCKIERLHADTVADKLQASCCESRNDQRQSHPKFAAAVHLFPTPRSRAQGSRCRNDQCERHDPLVRTV